MQDGLFRFKIPVRCARSFLQALRLIEWVRLLELGDPINIDLHRGGTKGERVRVPDRNICMVKLLIKKGLQKSRLLLPAS